MAGGTARRERKVVTVVFCDLVGFTTRAESLDPEDVEAILRPYHERVRAELERHGGTVEKFIGDAVMALFGAPTAHEDDPERAVRAALAIREFALEEGLELRVGITTGEALVSLDAEPAAGRGHGLGRRRQHRCPTAEWRPGKRNPRRRHDLSGRRGMRSTTTSRRRSRPRASRRRSRSGGARGALALRRRRRARGTRASSSAASASWASCGTPSTCPPRPDAAAPHSRGRAWDRQEPPRLRADARSSRPTRS